MKRFILIALIGFYACDVISQTRIGIITSGDYNGAFYTNEANRSFSKKFDRPSVGSTLGIQASFQKGSHYRFDIGITHMMYTSRVNFYAEGFSTIAANSLLAFESNIKERYVSIPCNFNFMLNKGSSQLFTTIGILPMYMTRYYLDVTQVDNNQIRRFSSVSSMSALNSIALGAQFSMGLWQRISPQFDISVAPTFRIWSLLSEISFNYYIPYSAGVQMGLYYKFGNKEKTKQ